MDLQVDLQASALKVPAVQWAVFTDDPRSRLRADLVRLQRLVHERRVEQGNAPAMPEAAHLAAVWDRLFSSIPGDRVLMLMPIPERQFVKSDDASGQRWIVTKAVRKDSNAYCWCIPLDAATSGRGPSITLGDANALNLADVANDHEDGSRSSGRGDR